MEQMDLKTAQAVYKSLCQMLDDRGWRYQKKEESLSIVCGVQGDDLPMAIKITVDAKRDLVTLLSGMPFDVPAKRRDALAVAVSKANYGIVDGSFDYNYLTGEIGFRLTASYRESLIGKNMMAYMLAVSCNTIDEYNDKFLAVAKSEMSVEEILNFIR